MAQMKGTYLNDIHISCLVLIPGTMVPFSFYVIKFNFKYV